MSSPNTISPVSRTLLTVCEPRVLRSSCEVLLTGMEVAGAAIGTLSLTIQLADRVEELRTFFKSFRDAPQEVAELGESLKTLRLVLTERAERLPLPNTALKHALSQCDRRITPLEECVRRLEPRFKSSRVSVRLWARLSATQNAAYVKKLRDDLMEAKANLMLVIQLLQEYVLSLFFVLRLHPHFA